MNFNLIYNELVLPGPFLLLCVDSLPIYKLYCGCGPIIGFQTNCFMGKSDSLSVWFLWCEIL